MREPRPEAGNHAEPKKKLVLPESVPRSVRLAMWAAWNVPLASPTGLVVPGNAGDVCGLAFGHQASPTRLPEAMRAVESPAVHNSEI